MSSIKARNIAEAGIVLLVGFLLVVTILAIGWSVERDYSPASCAVCTPTPIPGPDPHRGGPVFVKATC